MRPRSSLISRLFLLLGVLGAGFLVLAVQLYTTTERILNRELETELRGDLGLMAHAVEADPGLLRLPRSDSLAKALSRYKGYRVTVIASDGRLLGDSHVPAESLALIENHAGRPEVVEARRSGFGTAQRFSSTVGQNMFYVAKSLGPDAPTLRLAAGPATFQGFQREALRAALWALLLFLGAALAITLWVSQRISLPLLRLRGRARDVSKPLRWEAPFLEAEILNQAFAEYAEAVGKLAAEVRQERDRLRAVLDRLEEGVVLMHRGTIHAVNESALKLLPLRAGSEPLEGKRFALVVAHEGLRRWALETNPDSPLGGVYQVDKGPDSALDLLCHLRLLQPGDSDGEALLTLVDVTGFRNLDRAKTDFVANASHELKTPLSSILGYAEALIDGAAENPKARDPFLRKIHANALRLQGLVQDLLNLSQLENPEGGPQVESLPVRGFAQAAWNQHRAEAERNGIRFENRLPDELVLRMDPRDLDLILGNLVGNAVKYNHPGGKVQVEWEPEARVLGVRDTGYGIPAEALPRIFERFYRGDPARARGEGTGLGLAIVKHSAQRYGIQVSAESLVGEGSRFRLEVPPELIVSF